jgi:hypothetical protein
MSRRGIQQWASDGNDPPEEIFSDDYVNHQESDVEGGVTTKNLHAWKELVRSYHRAFTGSTVRV